MLVSSGIVYISLAMTISVGLVFTLLRAYAPQQASDVAIWVRFAVTAATIPALLSLGWWRRGL